MNHLTCKILSAVMLLSAVPAACGEDAAAPASRRNRLPEAGHQVNDREPVARAELPDGLLHALDHDQRSVSLFRPVSASQVFGLPGHSLPVGESIPVLPPVVRHENGVLRPVPDRLESQFVNDTAPCGAESAGCGSSPCCLPCACDESCRNWTLRAGTILMHRESPNAGLLFSNPANPTEFVNAGGFDFSPQAGLDVSMIRHRTFGDADLEFRYVGIHEWSDTQFANLSGNPLLIHTNPPTFFSGNRYLTSIYASNLDSAEFNVRNRSAFGTHWMSLSAGLRYLRFRERLDTYMADSIAAPAAPDEAFNVAAENNLFGIQAGADVFLVNCCDCCWKLHGKGGVFLNSVSQSSALYHLATPTTTFTPAQDDTDVAYVGELGISATHRITRCLNLRTGYQALWLNGVATAAGQFPAISPASLDGLNDDELVFFHGGTFQLEFVY